MKIRALYILPHLLLILINSAFVVLQLTTDDAVAREQLAHFIIETPATATPLVASLTEQGWGPVLWRETVALPISHFESRDFQPLKRLETQLLEGDRRTLPQLSRLLEEFQPADKTGELIFVPGGRGQNELVDALRDYGGRYFLHADYKLPPIFGPFIWVVITLILLVFLDERRWTLISMLALLPGFFIQLPLYLGLLMLLCLCIREVLISVNRGLRRYVNNDPRIVLPTRLKDGALFMWARIRLDATAHAVWVLGICLVLVCYTIIAGEFAGLSVILLLVLLLFLFFGELARSVQLVQNKDHRLFFATHITPAGLLHPRKERVALLTVVVLALSLPLLFRVNTAPFPTILLKPQLVGSIQSDRDVEALVGRITKLLDQRILGGVQDTDNYAVVDILLADRAYQEIFPYLGLTTNEGAGRYENGGVYLTRYTRSDNILSFYDERVFELTEQWIITALSTISGSDMLQLYTDGKQWYDIQPSSSVRVFSQSWAVMLEILLLLVAGLPWMGRWHYQLLKITTSGIKKMGGQS